MGKSKNQHVVKHSDGWAVKSAGGKKATRVVSTQNQAINLAKNIVKNQKSELFIHSKNGQIRERNSYGNDNFPLKG